jgi:hypothetical protein
MLHETRQRILGRLKDDDLVLDIGGWADPFERADWVMDVLPYETRGLYARWGWKEPGHPPAERFTEKTWITRDICDRDPYPFDDDQFDFVICAQTLEDVHDPMWVCSEMSRIGKAGYIGVPSRLEEQSWGVAGAYVGHAHHHWLVDIDGSHIDFVFKAHDVHSSSSFYFPEGFWEQLSYDERVQELWWEGSFSWAERSLVFPEPRHAYFSELVARELAARPARSPERSRLLQRLRERLAPSCRR